MARHMGGVDNAYKILTEVQQGRKHRRFRRGFVNNVALQ